MAQNCSRHTIRILHDNKLKRENITYDDLLTQHCSLRKRLSTVSSERFGSLQNV